MTDFLDYSRGSSGPRPGATARRGLEGSSATVVDVAPVADGHDQDEEDVVVDLVDDAVVTRANPPLTVSPYEFLRRVRSGLVREQFDRGLHAASRIGGELA